MLPHVLSDQDEDLIAVAFFLDGGCDQIDERVVWSSLQAPYIATYNQVWPLGVSECNASL